MPNDAFKAAVERFDAKMAEIRHQVQINVDIAKRDAPEGPIVDGKRLPGVCHSQEILAGHVFDRLNELDAIFQAALLAMGPGEWSASHDAAADVLYIGKTGVPADHGQSTEDGVIFRFKDDQVIGVTILDSTTLCARLAKAALATERAEREKVERANKRRGVKIIEMTEKVGMWMCRTETAEAQVTALEKQLAEARAALPEWDQRYPTVFYDVTRESRISIAAYHGHDTISFKWLLENKPGGRWLWAEYAPEEALQIALAILNKPIVRALAQPLQPQDEKEDGK